MTNHNNGGDPGNYQDITFNPLASANSLLASNYNTSSYVCTNVYCHSNGGKRNAIV